MSQTCLAKLISLTMVLSALSIAAASAQSTGVPSESAQVSNLCTTEYLYTFAAEKVFDAVLSYSKTIEEKLNKDRKKLRLKWIKPKIEIDKPSGIIVHRIVFRSGIGNGPSPARYEVFNRTYWIRQMDSQRSIMTLNAQSYGWEDQPKAMRPGSHKQTGNFLLRSCAAPELKLEAGSLAGDMRIE
jgi:hypothetical protein